jgi:hydrolase, tatD family
MRGKENSPENVKYVISKISSILGVSEKEIEKITTYNAKKIYNICD